VKDGAICYSLTWRFVLLMNTTASHAQGLEGEPLRKAAALWDGSRRLPKATQDPPSLLMLALLMGTIRARRWIDANTLGSFREPPVYLEVFRWLQKHRAAILESVSPPARTHRLFRSEIHKTQTAVDWRIAR
jgi:hypothetical protein